jgi:hypothetical protein
MHLGTSSLQEWDTDILLGNSTSSRERLQLRTRKSLDSLSSSRTSLDGSPGGILAPKKESETEGASRVSPPGVDPSTLRISVSKPDLRIRYYAQASNFLFAARLAALGSGCGGDIRDFQVSPAYGRQSTSMLSSRSSATPNCSLSRKGQSGAGKRFEEAAQARTLLRPCKWSTYFVARVVSVSHHDLLPIGMRPNRLC